MPSIKSCLFVADFMDALICSEVLKHHGGGKLEEVSLMLSSALERERSTKWTMGQHTCDTTIRQMTYLSLTREDRMKMCSLSRKV